MMKQKILLTNYLAPGDIVMLTAAVRDLYKSYSDKFIINVETSCGDIWESNPYITRFKYIRKDGKVYDEDTGEEITEIRCNYNLIHQSNQLPYHFIHGFRLDLEQRLGLNIPVTAFKGDIHISDLEKSWMSVLDEMRVKDDFWIVFAGGKYDFSTKWFNPDSYQKIIDHFRGKITFVQCGDSSHWHPPLKNVINLVGKTDLRQLIRLVYHSVGVLCPITFGMHAAAAVPIKKHGLSIRPCVVIAGGREPVHWEQYPGHQFLSNVGSLPCCSSGGCWKSRCQKVYDNDPKDEDKNLCSLPVVINKDLSIPKCMDMIRPEYVIQAIESYYEGGMLKYGSSI